VEKSKTENNSTKQYSVLKNNESCCQKTAETSYVIAKLLPQNNVDNFQPLVAVVQNFISFSPISPYQGKSHFKNFIYLPPKKDIRIIIQSFQI
jgi:hypothetical protein